MTVWLCCAAAYAAPAATVPLSAALPRLPGQGTLVMDLRESSAIALVGPITTEALTSVRRIGSAGNRLQLMYIDSPGGDVVSAIELAHYLRQKKTRLVVAGRCFSACANYLFAGAVAKDVLPGSLVAIHGLRYQHFDKDQVTDFSAGDRAALGRLAQKDGSAGPRIQAILAREQAFYRDVGIRTSTHLAFRRYDEARQAHRTTTPDCPAFALWALSRADLERMGVIGIRMFWTPATQQEARTAAEKLGMQPSAVYFGSEATLAGMCGQKRGLLQDLRAILR